MMCEQISNGKVTSGKTNLSRVFVKLEMVIGETIWVNLLHYVLELPFSDGSYNSTNGMCPDHNFYCYFRKLYIITALPILFAVLFA